MNSFSVFSDQTTIGMERCLDATGIHPSCLSRTKSRGAFASDMTLAQHHFIGFGCCYNSVCTNLTTYHSALRLTFSPEQQPIPQKASEGQFEDPDSIRICHTCMLPGESANHFGITGEQPPPPAKRARKDDGGTAENGDETEETVERPARLERPSNYTLRRRFGLDCVDQTSWKYQGVDKSIQIRSSTILQKYHLVADLSHLEHGRLW
jgi:hypothetical protein